jgi:hypothetical protein
VEPAYESNVTEWYVQAKALVEAWTPLFDLYDRYHGKFAINIKWYGPTLRTLTPVQRLVHDFNNYELDSQIQESMREHFWECIDDVGKELGLEITYRGSQGGWLIPGDFRFEDYQDDLESLVKHLKEYERVFLQDRLELWELLEYDETRSRVLEEFDEHFNSSRLSLEEAEDLTKLHTEVTGYMAYLDTDWCSKVYDRLADEFDLSPPCINVEGPGVGAHRELLYSFLCVDTVGGSCITDSTVKIWPLRPLTETECETLRYLTHLATGIPVQVTCTPEPELEAVERALKDYFGLTEPEEDEELDECLQLL